MTHPDERPTPETDAVMRGPGPFRNGATREELRLADFARRLERERDALRAALRELLDDIGPVNHDLCDPPCIHRRARALLGEAT